MLRPRILAAPGMGRRNVRTTLLTLTAAGVMFGVMLGDAAATAPDNALSFNGSSQYVRFGTVVPTPGNSDKLNATNFTLETWFNRAGVGSTTSTGTGGVVAAPLIAKGRAEAENSTADMNYFLGVDANGKLVADFEEGPGTSAGLNHPITGVTTVTNNVWHHAAVTYNGQTWKVYLDGRLDATQTLAAAAAPRSDSIQRTAVGSALTTDGMALGFFQGTIDEVRIWNAVRSGAQIRAAKDTEVSGPATGLVGCWHFDEGSTSSTADCSASGTLISGTLVSAPTWVVGYTFAADGAAPAAPQNVVAAPGNNSVSLSWSANSESDLAGYNVFRSTSSPVNTAGTPLNGADLLTGTSFNDTTALNGTPYFYVVSAVDGSNNATSSAEVGATPTSGGPKALQFNGSTQYVTFGAATSGLGATSFTVETWFQRTGAGVGVSTGAGGIASAVPLVTKGRFENEVPANLNMNYFLGIDSGTNTLVGDFEDTVNGGNHPVSGTTVITNNVWHHAAATYDGTTWRIYLDGKLDAKLNVGSFTPESTSVQHAALASALDSSGAAAGFFQGLIDEARIWNVARSGSQIRSSKNTEITGAQAGLRGRWGLEAGSGTTAADSSGNGNVGNLIGSPSWVTGYGFPQDTNAPAAPTSLVANAGDATVGLTWNASGASDVAGYNVFRSTSPGVGTGGTPLNGGDLVGGTTFTDNTVSNGTTYYYVATAVDTADNSSGASNEDSAAPSAAGPHALQFNGSTQYVTFGQTTSSLGATSFTLETWFNRTGAGVGTNTGMGGFPNAVPLITKGRAEQETPANLNMNYFLGIDSGTNTLVGDFEDTVDGGNHPVSGTTVITSNVWHHAAATYDGTTWRLYLDGKLDAISTVGSFTPESTSVQHAALASALDSTGAAAGFFQGLMDEARIWNVARSGSQIRSSKNTEITGAQAGLRGRWGMDENVGTSVADSSGNGVGGTTVSSPGHVVGYGFPQDISAPAAATNLVASSGDNQVGLTWTPSGDADVAGYNVYRSTVSPVSTVGTPLNATDLVNGTTYTDASALNGTLYFYVVTAVDTANNGSLASNEDSATPTAPGGKALQFDGSNDHVTFGPATSALGVTNFTLETWVRRTGVGVGTSTGNLGIASAIPLVTKGRAENETPANVNMNYFLGIDATSGVLVGDFEDTAGGVNHPVIGTTAITSNVWHHAAATYDGTTWRLYLDGVLDKKLVVGNFTPESSSVQPAALATAITSASAAPPSEPAGFFAGEMDEVRIWSVARSGSQIRSNKDVELAGAQSGLKARWALDEASGTTVTDTSGNSVTGNTVGGPVHVTGYDFPQDASAPAAATNLVAGAGDNQVDLAWTASGASDVAGYNVYRSTVSPVPTIGAPINGSDLVSGTSYTDTTAVNGTTYYYVVTAVDTADNSSVASNEDSAAPVQGDPVLVGAGDIADCTNTGDTDTAALLAGIPGTVFTLGDNAYQDGTAAEFANCYQPTWGLQKARTHPTPGNHDYHTAGGTGYFDYFNGIGNQSGPAGDRSLGYYSYNIATTWHVVVLNSECDPAGGESGLWNPGGCASGSAQDLWLKNDLASSPTNNIIAMWHRPLFSSTGNHAYMAALFQDLYNGGVDLYLGGHWHNYERLAPMNPSGNADSTYGVREFVVGTGGADFAGFGATHPRSEVRQANTNGVLKLTLHASSYDWQFIPTSGTFTDSGSQATHGAPPDTVTPVVTVVSMVPSTIGPSGTADLTWNASENGSYSVRVGGTSCATGAQVSSGAYTTAPANVVTTVSGSDLTDGSNTLRVCVTDTGPNTGSATTTLTRDGTAPTVNVVSAVPSTIGGTMSSNVTWHASENGAYSVRVGGTDCTDGTQLASGTYSTSPANVVTAVAASSLADGPNTIRVCVTDAYSNTGSATTTVTKDGSTPTVTVVSANPSTLSPSTLSTDITWHADENGTYSVRVGGTDCLTGTQVASGTYSSAPLDTFTTVSASALADGQNTVRVCVTDSVTNTGSDSIVVTKTPPTAITLRSVSSGTNAATASLVVSRPAGTAVGDLLLASITVLTPVAVTPPSGWSLIRLDVSGAGATGSEQALYYRVAGGSEPASYTWTFASAHGAAGIVLAYAGVDGASPIEASSGAVRYATAVPAPSVTTTAAGSMVVGLFGTTGQTTFSPPAGMAEQAEVANAGAQKVTGEAAQVLQPALGASGAKTGTAGVTGRMIGQLVALQPAAGGGGGGGAPPVIDTVVINQSSPKTNDVLSASITSHDPDGDTVSYTYQWTKNGSDIAGVNGTGATLDLSLALNGDRGDAIALRVTGSDGVNSSTPVTSAPVTIVNSAPTATVALSDTTPATNDTLTATATKADADGDAVSLTYVWKVNGTPKQTTTTTSLTDTFDLSVAGNGDDNDVIVVEVTPNDGTVNGTLATATANVGAPPTAITLRSVSSGTNAATASLVVSRPAGTAVGDLLLASITVLTPVAVTPPSGWSLIRLDVSGAGATGSEQALYYRVAGGSEPASYTWTFASAHGAAGIVLAYAGVDGASPIEASSGAVRYGTAVPAPSVTTTAAGSMVVGLFGTTGQTTFSPPAGMAEQVEVANAGAQKVTGEAAQVLQPALGASGAKTGTAGVTGRMIGQLVALQPAAGGGGGGGAPPVIDTVVINQSSPKTNDVLSASITSHDPDGDTVSYTYQWTKNGSDIAGVNGTGATLDLSLALNGDRGDAIALRVTGSDGANSSTPVTSAPVTIVNSAPTATVALSDTTPATNDTLTATATKADADGDAVSLTYVWKVNGTPKQTTNTTSLTDTFDLSVAGNGDDNDVIVVEVTPNDGTVNGTLATATANVGSSAGIVFRSFSSGTNAVATSLVLSQPAGVIQGDLLLAVVDVIAAPVVTAPVGWTLVRNDVSGTGVTALRQALYSHVFGVGETATYTWTFASAHGASGGILAYSGVDGANPVEASSGQASSDVAVVTAPSVTTTSANSMVVGFFGMTGQRSFTPPAGMGEHFDLALANPPGEKVSSESADVLQAGPGATGAKVATASSPSGRSVGQLVALKPAP